ncbi:unnamed protein product [Prunus armeniaca]
MANSIPVRFNRGSLHFIVSSLVCSVKKCWRIFFHVSNLEWFNLGFLFGLGGSERSHLFQLHLGVNLVRTLISSSSSCFFSFLFSFWIENLML